MSTPPARAHPPLDPPYLLRRPRVLNFTRDKSRFPLSCLKLLLNWLSLIIVPPRGSWASEVPASSPRRSLSKSTRYPPRTFSSFFCRLGGLKKTFLPPSVADRLPHTFPDASGVHFGTSFGLNKNVLLLICFWFRRSSVL